jgi:DNA-binding beta-propeller fold protein YncE
MVLNHQGTRAYVAEEMTNEVVVVDLADGRVLARTGTDVSPSGLALSPDGDRLYVACTGNNEGSLDVMSTLSDRVVSRLAVGGQPNDVVLSPDGCYAYVASVGAVPWAPTPDGGSSDGVLIVNTATGHVTGWVRTVSDPENVVVSPDGKTLYLISGYGDNRSYLQVLSVAPASAVATISQPGYEADGIAVSPDGSSVYETADEAGITDTVRVLSAHKDEMVGGVEAPGGFGIAFGPAGRDAYVADAAVPDITVIDAGDNKVSGSVPVPNPSESTVTPVDIAISTNGLEAYVLSSDLFEDLPGY